MSKETYFKLTYADIMQICFDFVFREDHPSETDQVQFSKDFFETFERFEKVNNFMKDFENSFDPSKFVGRPNEELLNYQKAYHIFMEHFDSLPDDVKQDVDEQLSELNL